MICEKSSLNNFNFLFYWNVKQDIIPFLNNDPLACIFPKCSKLSSKIHNLGSRDETISLTYDNSDENSNFDAGIRMADDKSRARISFIGTLAGVILAANPPEFSDNFGETS